jgi:5-(aminomethyl)-3-furanmethanol phosphate kinase
MWVIKLGGSLLGSNELQQWLNLIAQHGDGKVIIVPGGGMFADAVREAQRQTGISDHAAHHMAVMAMDQYGLLMKDLNVDLATASSELELAERGWQHRGIVWLPSKMICADEGIPANWQVTSDSLAAWLAIKMNALHLVIIKSTLPDARESSALELAQQGLVDEYFADFIAHQNFSTWVLGKHDHPAFAQGFSTDKLTQTGVKVVD